MIRKILLGTLILTLAGCKKDLPTNPPAATKTKTPAPPAFTITSSPTSTATSTFTSTFTSSPTSAPPTDSPTNSPVPPSFTPTDSFTLSPTPLPTNTPTATYSFSSTTVPTSTNTKSPTPTWTYTQTPTFSNTPGAGTPSDTPTQTGTPTWTPYTCWATSTATPTPTPSTDLLQGIITYTGSQAAVGANNEIIVAISSDPNLGNMIDARLVLVNGGSYSLNAPSSGVYYAFMLLNAAGSHDGESWVHVGDPKMLFNGRCAFPMDPITISGPTSQNFTFGDSCGGFQGVTGNINYTGSRGLPSTCRMLIVVAYSDPGYTTVIDDNGFHRNNIRYDLDTDNSGYANGATVYLRAFFDVYGNAWQSCAGKSCPQTGDPYINVGAVVVGTSNPVNINFGDAQIW